MSRIELNDSLLSMIVKMAEGNPGATVAMSNMVKDGGKIDPDSALGGIGGVLSLDTHGIYGHRIWMLYSDVCGQDLTKTLAVLRSMQLGLVRESVVAKAIDNFGDGLDVDAVLLMVKDRLPEFGKAA